MQTSSADLWETIALEAERESPLWQEALLERGQRELVPIFSPLADPRFAPGIESIYEGYLLHYGRPRLFAPRDSDTGLLLGDYLYAHGLVRISALGEVDAVADLGELISLSAFLRAEGRDGDGSAWAGTAAALGQGRLEAPRAALHRDGDADPLRRLAIAAVGAEAVERALALHGARVR